MPTLALLAALALVLASCGDAEHAPTETTPAGAGPLVVYSRSGGIGGVIERLTVQRDGRARLEVGIEAKRRKLRISAAALAQLRDQLRASDLDVDRPDGDGVCADCFVYELDHAGRHVSFDDADRPSRSLAALVADLGAIVEDNYPAAAAGVKGG